MYIRRLAEADAQSLWELRLEGLENDSLAFGESAEEHRLTPVSTYAERLRKGGEENFVLGAFEDETLVGLVGFHRSQRQKRRHKGTVWGMLVTPAHRGRGVGHALVTHLIAEARRLPGLTHIQLSVASTQPAARRLYESCGFRSYGIEPQALCEGGEYVDEEFMYLAL